MLGGSCGWGVGLRVIIVGGEQVDLSDARLERGETYCATVITVWKI